MRIGTPLVPPTFFQSSLPIRPRSKIKRRQIPAICFEFCRCSSVPLASKQTGLSDKTVRAVYKEIRFLLLDPRYRKWHNFDLASVYYFRNANEILEEIWRCFGECYFDDECFRNFRYGKRSQRQCRECPAQKSATLTSILSPGLNTTMLDLVDTVRAYYQILGGLSKEKVVDRTENFKLRAYHTTILLTAQMASSKIDDGIVETCILAEGDGSLRELWSTLLEHIEERGFL